MPPPLPSAAFTRRPAAPVPQCRAAPSPALYGRRGPRAEEPARRAPGPARPASCLLGGSIAARGGSAAGGAGGRRKEGAEAGGGGGKGAAAGAGCSLLPGEAPATGATPASLPRGSGGARGGCSAPLRPALARGAVNGRPDGAGWGGQGRARPVRTLLRRVPLGAAGVVSLGRRQPFRALSVSRSSRGCTCGDGTGGGRHRDKDGASPPRGRGLSRS